MCGAAGDDHAAVGEDQAGGQVQVIGEDGRACRRLPSPLVSSRIRMRSSPGAAAQHAIRVVDRLDHPQPAALVERERDRLAAEHRLLREQLHLELGRRLDELLRVGRGHRHLVLRRRIALLVVRDVEAVDVLDRRHLQPLPRRARLVVDRPHDALLDQLLEAGVAPGPLVVADTRCRRRGPCPASAPTCTARGRPCRRAPSARCDRPGCGACGRRSRPRS